MQEAVPVGAGAMAAVLGLDEADVAAACDDASAEGIVTPTNLNARAQIVIAGEARAVARAGEQANARGAKRVMALAVRAPFHCPWMRPAEERLAPELRALDVNDPAIPVVANVDAESKQDGAAAIDALIRQVSSPARGEAVVRRLIAAGARTFVEMGPGTVLSGLIRKIDGSVTTVSIENSQGLEKALTTPADKSSDTGLS